MNSSSIQVAMNVIIWLISDVVSINDRGCAIEIKLYYQQPRYIGTGRDGQSTTALVFIVPLMYRV